jgi:hypothetical protein
MDFTDWLFNRLSLIEFPPVECKTRYGLRSADLNVSFYDRGEPSSPSIMHVRIAAKNGNGAKTFLIRAASANHVTREEVKWR